MSAPYAYEYAVIRVVPRAEREEFVNAGVILFCDAREYLRAKIELDAPRLLALCKEIDLTIVNDHLQAVDRVAKGGAAAGPIGLFTLRERFRKARFFMTPNIAITSSISSAVAFLGRITTAELPLPSPNGSSTRCTSASGVVTPPLSWRAGRCTPVGAFWGG